MTQSPGATLSGLRRFAQEQEIELVDLAVPQGHAVVTPTWGGRIEFLGAGEENALWTQTDFHETGTWGWNKGGARSWYSPEGGAKGIYFSADWKDWQCPAPMDPGQYRIRSHEPMRIVLENEFQATSNDGTQYRLRMTRDIGVGAVPAGISGDVVCIPIAFAHSFQNLSSRSIEREIDLWHLVQIRPSGTIIVPLREGSGPAYRDYFEPVPQERVAVTDEALTLRIDGARRYKLGVPADRAKGTIGYLREDGERASLFVKRFAVDAQGVYADRPEIDQQTNGDPIQMYNHLTGGPDGFGEIECHSPASVLQPAGGQVFPIEILLLEGPREAVRADGSKLLGVDLNALKIF